MYWGTKSAFGLLPWALLSTTSHHTSNHFPPPFRLYTLHHLHRIQPLETTLRLLQLIQLFPLNMPITRHNNHKQTTWQNLATTTSTTHLRIIFTLSTPQHPIQPFPIIRHTTHTPSFKFNPLPISLWASIRTKHERGLKKKKQQHERGLKKKMLDKKIFGHFHWFSHFDENHQKDHRKKEKRSRKNKINTIPLQDEIDLHHFVYMGSWMLMLGWGKGWWDNCHHGNIHSHPTNPSPTPHLNVLPI